MTFHGFGDGLVPFYEGLEADNSKAYWSDHKATYDSEIRAPLEALLADLEPEFGEGKVFRPYRDVRFSKDKSPYKTHAAAVIGMTADGAGQGMYYLQVGADGLMVGAGMYEMARDQLDRYRRAVSDDVAGAALQRLVAGLDAAGYQTGGHDQLKRAPRGFDPEHPRIDLLRQKGMTAGRVFEPDDRLHTPQCRELVKSTWDELRPLNAWLAAHVGATALERR
jgi:uncharacterized protein (TIGR02453 family)